MQKAKIVIIGAGSVIFGIACLRDAFSTRELWGSELVFVDLNEEALARTVKIAERMNSELGAGYRISATTDRRKALPGSEFVIVSVAVDKNELWKKDFTIPIKHGIKHVLGENGGPGAVFHTMRNIPIVLGICRDMEELCPDALLINFTNPESRICLAVSKYTKIKAVGLCHGIGEGIRIVSKIMGRNPAEIDVKASGLNHFTWFSDIREKATGKDLYNELREKEKSFDPSYEKLSRFMFNRFGLFPTTGDGHIGEFIPYAHEMIGMDGYDFNADAEHRNLILRHVCKLADGTAAINEKFMYYGYEASADTPSGEIAFKIIKGILYNTNELLLSVNIPNDGYIANLPGDAIVEVPAIVCGAGVKGIGMGALPDGIAALCTAQVNVQKLVVKAGVTGDRELVLQALLADPNVTSAKSALSLYEELMEVHKPYLPQFS